MAEATKDFIDFLENYCKLLQEMAALEDSLLEAVLSHETELIEQQLSHQQAASMKLQGYEEQRGRMQAKAGYPETYTLSQIAAELPGPDGERVRQCKRAMEDAVSQIRYTGDKISRMAQLNLRMMNVTVDGEGNKKAQRYTETGANQGGPLFGTEV